MVLIRDLAMGWGIGSRLLSSSLKSSLEINFQLVEDGVALESPRRGRQALIKTEFALNKATKPKDASIS